jgi:hypothetical protein
MLEWAFQKDNKVRIKFIEEELERVKSNIAEISKSQKVDANWRMVKIKALAVTRFNMSTLFK